MVDLPARKVGIIACSGEEIAEGTVSRLAALRVLHETRRGDTVTLCLPLFLAGGGTERTFARFYPTITVDGCELRCAARATEKYSAKPVASVVVTELAKERGIEGIEGRRRLNEAGRLAVTATAEVLSELVGEVLGKPERPVEVGPGASEPGQAVTCSCGSGVPVAWLEVGGRRVEVKALPALMKRLHDAARPADEATTGELLAQVKIYNEVAEGSDRPWLEALAQAYADFCAGEKGRS